MRRILVIALSSAFLSTLPAGFSGDATAAEKADKPDKSLFERNHDALQRAEKRGDVQPRTAPDRLLNDSERRQMQRLENDPSNK
jgi:hypothetical protein